ncbi:MAG: hypothetical protein NTZ74_05840 [Chloroflexi bacterium]|nr:hypothetical protein [Chloroflexota bacterium]
MTLANFQFSKNNPGGKDFLVHWTGTRMFLLKGISPYSDQTALEIQTSVYGRPAIQGEHELRVATPLYSIILFVPFAIINDFTLARSLWMTLLEFSIVGIVYLSAQLQLSKMKNRTVVVYSLFGIFFYHGIRPLINGNPVIIITLLILCAIVAIYKGNDEIAGLMMALSTINLQNVILVLVFILIWALIKKRLKILSWFFGSMALLVGLSVVLLPDWIQQNYREIVRYSSYNLPGSPGAVMVTWWGDIGSRISIGLTVLLTVLLIFDWWQIKIMRSKQFVWTAMVTLSLSQWIGIQTDPENFILLYPGLFLGLHLLWERWNDRAVGLIFTILAVLFIGVWVLFLSTINYEYQPVQNAVMFFPFPFVVIALLYWSGWWVKNSNKINLGTDNYKE